jgi:hypothetical protein
MNPDSTVSLAQRLNRSSQRKQYKLAPTTRQPIANLLPIKSQPSGLPMTSIFARRRWTQLAAALAVLVIVGYGFVFAHRPEQSDWYCCYVRAALRMQQGERIHFVDPCPYAYPPLMAMLTIPLAQLPLNVGIVAWYGVSVAALAIAVVYAWRLIGGPSRGPFGGRFAAVAALGLLLSSRFIIIPLERRQFDAVIAALLMAGCWRLARGVQHGETQHSGQLSGGLLLGLAAAMKCTPLLLVPYLVWRRWYRAAVLVAVTAVAANLLPEFCFPQQSGRWYLADWKHQFLDVSQRVPPGTWFSGLPQNQSLAGMFQRLFRYGLPLSTQAIRAGKLPAGSVPLLRACVLGAIALLGLLTLYFARRKRSQCRARAIDPGPVDGEFTRRIAAEVSAVFALMLLASPMTSRGHYLILILPTLLVCRAAIIERDVFSRWLLPALLICGPLMSKGLVGKTLGDLSLAWSLPTWYAILCLVSMWRTLGRGHSTGRVVDMPATWARLFRNPSPSGRG